MPTFVHFLRRFALLSVLLLAACTQQQDMDRLPPEEVMQKAAEASRNLESARYVLDGDVTAAGERWDAEGTARIEGAMTHGGTQMQFRMDTDMDVRHDTEGEFTVDGTLEVIVAGGEEVYLNLHALSVEPSGHLFRPELVGAFAGKWWQLPPGDRVPATRMTPDPRLVQLQSQVVRVTDDLGMDRIGEQNTYHYRVELDRGKLIDYLSTLAAERGEAFDAAAYRQRLDALSAAGELWVDARDFYLRRARWEIEGVPLQQLGFVGGEVTITFRDMNANLTVTPPEEAERFSPGAFLGDTGQLPPFPAAPGTSAQEQPDSFLSR